MYTGEDTCVEYDCIHGVRTQLVFIMREVKHDFLPMKIGVYIESPWPKMSYSGLSAFDMSRR
jgi:hypothetical protein